MSYRHQPKVLSDVVKHVYSQLLSKETMDEFNAAKKWSEVVGKHIANVSEVEKISDGVLYIKVKSSAWRNELVFKKMGIIAQMNADIGHALIKDIIFR